MEANTLKLAKLYKLEQSNDWLDQGTGYPALKKLNVILI
jgi:hypothetical protein